MGIGVRGVGGLVVVLTAASPAGCGDDGGTARPAADSSTGAIATGSSSGSTGAPPAGTDSTAASDETFGCPTVTYYPDYDEDGYGDSEFPVDACLVPPAHVEQPGDCDDDNPEVNPGMEESCNSVDDDCDGLTDEASPSNTTCQECTLLVEGDHAYYVCPQALTWDAARVHCGLFYADLVEVADQAEYDLLLAQPLTGPAVYIGLNDIEREGSFVWPDGSPEVFSAWGEGEPNDALDGEDCVQIAVATALWNDIACTATGSFVCEAVAGGGS